MSRFKRSKAYVVEKVNLGPVYVNLYSVLWADVSDNGPAKMAVWMVNTRLRSLVIARAMNHISINVMWFEAMKICKE